MTKSGVGLVRGCHDVSSWFAALCLGLKMGLRRGWRGRRGEGQAVWAWQRGGSVSENAARCICHCTALRCPTQRAASVIAPRCVSWDGAEQVGGNRFGSLLPARPSGLVVRLAGGGGSGWLYQPGTFYVCTTQEVGHRHLLLARQLQFLQIYVAVLGS